MQGMKAPDDLSLRTMGPDDLALALDWAAEEGWNPGIHDAPCFLAPDPDGFLVGERNGEPVSCISVVTYPGDFAFLGFYIVRKEFRGRGYGFKTWKAGLKRANGCVIGLDGVVAQQKNYEKSGFTHAWNNIRYGGRIGALPRPSRHAGTLLPLAEISAAAIEAYDRKHFPSPRPAFLRLWMTRPGTSALGLQRGGSLAGYGVIRPCRDGYKIGPLFADDESAAEALLAKLAEQAVGSKLYIDTPEPNITAQRLADNLDLKPVFETARMYLGPAPIINRRGIFGITSFELG
jgi:hypothetical protein